MPYIDGSIRRYVDKRLGEFQINNPGVLNYAITKICQQYMKDNRGGSPTYEDYNRIIGVLESVKLEFYRRAVSAYEDKKIQENGDVY